MKFDIVSFTDAKSVDSTDVKGLDILTELYFDRIISQVLPQIKKANFVKSAKTKSVAEVNMSTAKIGPQKGSGRSRKVSGVATSFRGGSKSFGPVGITKIHSNPSWKSRRMCMLGLFSKAIQDNRIKVCDKINLSSLKTSDLQKSLNGIFQFNDTRPHILVVFPGDKIDSNFMLAARNLFFVEPTLINNITANKIQNSHYVLFSKDSLAEFVTNYLDISL